MKILSIFTGGTIGCRKSVDGILTAKEKAPYQLLEMYKEKHGNQVEFSTLEPYCILSENLSAKYLTQLLAVVGEELKKDYDGIVITHGTDTLQYTAAMLGLVFEQAKIPIVLVSSNYILEDERANGSANFEGAVRFIEAKLGNGVFVSYQNTGESLTIHRATQLQCALQLSDRVSSISDNWYAKWREDGFERNTNYREKTYNLIFDTLPVRLTEKSKEILRIRPYPGMQYPTIPKETRVILHESYHSGTIPVGKELKKFVSEAKSRGIPIYVSGLSETEAVYETVKEYQELGIEPLPEGSVITQYCALWLRLSNEGEK